MPYSLFRANGVHDHMPSASGLSERTALAYTKDYDDFARFTGSTDGESALERLIGLPAEEANALVGRYLAYLQQKPLETATIARRINALRSAVKRLHALGRTGWLLEVAAPNVPRQRSRIPKMTKVACSLDKQLNDLERPRGRRIVEVKDARDRCIIRMLWGMKLHRSELVAINVEDVDPKGGWVMVQCWGRGNKRPMALPGEVGSVVGAWLDLHERKSGALFYSLHLGRPGARLTADAVHEIIRRLKSRIDPDLPVHPRSIGA